jgi:hypothetical protein
MTSVVVGRSTEPNASRCLDFAARKRLLAPGGCAAPRPNLCPVTEAACPPSAPSLRFGKQETL